MLPPKSATYRVRKSAVRPSPNATSLTGIRENFGTGLSERCVSASNALMVSS